MRWHPPPRSLAVLLVLACGEPDGGPPDASFGYEAPATPVPAPVLLSDTALSDEGYRIARVHLFLPSRITEAVARATLQHVIDSVAAADTTVAGVSATGFVLGPPDPSGQEADLIPAIQAFWGPIDTAGMTGRRRAARFRTAFTILRAFDAAATQDGR